jgi:uncharacterized membrane protein YeaQ/YmgE (transglycosylase-associated protein family)
MGIIAWLFLGLIAGFIGSKIVDHRGQGILRDIVLGIAGALLGGFLFHLVGGEGITGFNAWSLLVATGGAVVVLLLWNAITRRRRPADAVRAAGARQRYSGDAAMIPHRLDRRRRRRPNRHRGDSLPQLPQ